MSFQICEEQLSEINLFFNSKEEFVMYSKNWAKNLSFFLSKEKSESDRVVLICVRGGRERANGEQNRTIKCNCPFKITARKQKDERWKATLTNGFHNHPPIAATSVPQGRQLSESQKIEVCRMNESLISPRQIVSFLGLNNLVKTEDIYNTIKCFKRRKLKSKTQLHYLLDSFQEEDFFYNYTHKDGNQLTRLFFAFPKQIEMFINFSSVVMADCTYKTNRYKMPLLHFIGLSNVGKSFSIAFCFLKSESREDYVWALQAFVRCFKIIPHVIVTDQEDALINAAAYVFDGTTHLLCIWHLNKNVLKNCRPFFTSGDIFNSFMNDWNSIIYSESEKTFEDQYQTFQNTWAAIPRAVQYIARNLYPLRRKFAAPWTNRIRHFGCTSTSRAEGMHAQVKKYIQNSRADILGVCTALKLAVENQLNQISIIIEQQKVVNNHRFGLIFSEVKNKISTHALDLVLQQTKMDRPLRDCTNSFNQIYGIPCGHALDIKMQQRKKLEVSDFADQWRLFQINAALVEEDEFNSQLQRIQNVVDAGGDNIRRVIITQLEEIASNSKILNPTVVASGRGRPIGATNSTRRDPSGFEYVEAAAETAEFEQKLVDLCRNLQIYLKTHTYHNIIENAQNQGVPLVGFSQSMCSLMKLGKSCVKNRDTVSWLTNFFSNDVNNNLIDNQ